MPYTILPSDPNNNPIIEVDDQTFNTETSLVFPGQNTRGYSLHIATNFYKLMENFSSPTPPENPLQGQLWYDNSETVNQLFIYDGTQWIPAAGINKSAVRPTAVTTGDIWVDTINQQLYIFSGGDWVLVGPNYSSGEITGIRNEDLIDIDNIARPVVITYVNGIILSIISQVQFIPKTVLTGFEVVYAGVNLNSTIPSLQGQSSTALSLKVGTTEISSDKFLRRDQNESTDYTWEFQSLAGTFFGPENQLKLSVTSNKTIVHNLFNDLGFDFRITRSSNPFSALTIDELGRIGVNNSSPASTLDIVGDVVISNNSSGVGGLLIESTSSSSISTAGGITVGGNLVVGGSVSTESISVDSFLPLSLTSNIGSSTSKFNNVYANSLTGNLLSRSGVEILNVGTSAGSAVFTGNVSGSATRLSTSTQFSIAGDITASPVSFNGTGPTVVLNATISQDIINDKTEITSLDDDDEFLVYRPSTLGLRKATKATLQSSFPVIPVGTVLTYAGSTAPVGYLFCDGTELRQSEYSELFTVIGYKYSGGSAASLLGINTFKLPDLRGRMMLGPDNMFNSGLFVQDKNPPNSLIQTGGALGAASRVPTATDVGLEFSGVNSSTSQAGTGSTNVTLSTSATPILPPAQTVNYIIYTGVF